MRQKYNSKKLRTKLSTGESFFVYSDNFINPPFPPPLPLSPLPFLSYSLPLCSWHPFDSRGQGRRAHAQEEQSASQELAPSLLCVGEGGGRGVRVTARASDSNVNGVIERNSRLVKWEGLHVHVSTWCGGTRGRR